MTLRVRNKSTVATSQATELYFGQNGGGSCGQIWVGNERESIYRTPLPPIKPRQVVILTVVLPVFEHPSCRPQSGVNGITVMADPDKKFRWGSTHEATVERSVRIQ